MAWFNRGREDGLPAEFTKTLEAAARELPGAEAQVKEIVRYVTTGGAAPTRHLPRGMASGYYPSSAQPAADRELFSLLETADPDIWVRWGRVLETFLGTSTWSTPLASAGLLPSWLELLVTSIGDAYGHPHGGRRGRAAPPTVPLDFAALVAAAEAGGTSAEELLQSLFTATDHLRYDGSLGGRQAVASMTGFAEALVAHLDGLSGRLTAGSVDQRVLFCTLVTGFADETLAPLAPHLAIASTANATQVRDAAQPLLLRVFTSGVPELQRLATQGAPDVRAQALGLLWQHGDDATRASAREIAAADRTERIRGLVDVWDRADAEPSSGPLPGVEVPPIPPISWRVDTTPAVRDAISRAVRANAQSIAQLNRHRAQMQARWPQMRSWAPVKEDPNLEGRLMKVLASETAPKLVKPDARYFETLATTAANSPALSLPALVKVLATTGNLCDHTDCLSHDAVRALEAHHARTGDPDLLTLQLLLDSMGLPGETIVWSAISRSWQTLARDWPDEQVWPFLVRNLDRVIALSRESGDYSTDPTAFYRLMGTLPVQPPALVEHLYGVALGPTKTHRNDAQRALHLDPERTARVTAALKDGKSDTRTTAAVWLTQIADPASIPALEAAVAKEKQDVAKGAMLDALEALGRPLETYIDRDKLAADAIKAKGLPKDLDWLSWDQLPKLHWADSGARLPISVVQHLVAQAVKAKSPEPNAMLRKYAALLDESDAHAFAHALLVAWISADLIPISEAEALQRASQHAASMHHWMRSSPQAFANDPMLGKTVAEMTAFYLPGIARTPAGSAVSSKGVLAVVAATGGREVVAPSERYLKDWYGQRAAQGKALIGMLAWVQHPTATQLLLSIGSRFRTKSFQVEATRQVEALADREGWTVAELADRTVPTAGFDADGRMDLPYGDRTFTARLLPDLTIELRNEDGAPIKTLPTARQSDDADKVKASKAALTAAKKELKSLVSLQRQRLYEALCTERTWVPDDWERFMAGHPVMRLLCQRLIWVAESLDGERTVFRLLDDGTLSDADDNEVRLPAGGVVRLAHDTNLTAEEVDAWLAHLADYEVAPLFGQLGKEMHSLSEEHLRQQAIDDFKGHTLEAFALRNRALKLGWTRGPAEDGGWFLTYLKRFPTLGLTAQLEFTGNPLPEENRTVGLLTLSFVREVPGQSMYGAQAVTLADVPAVLISETWHDVRSIAAEGGGFDPDWERNTQY